MKRTPRSRRATGHGSPGAKSWLSTSSAVRRGKTTLLERTLRDFQPNQTFFVIEGDQATTNDSLRIKAAGAPVVQINTGSGCHLDAGMVAQGLAELKPAFGSVVMIENVGNLVCPAMFDLGENAKVAILSVTEGDDKPIKYPHMFRAASLLLINKIDLLPYVAFDLDHCQDYARQVNPAIEIMTLSATTGEGLESWVDWLSAASRRERGGDIPAAHGGRAVIVSSSLGTARSNLSSRAGLPAIPVSDLPAWPKTTGARAAHGPHGPRARRSAAAIIPQAAGNLPRAEIDTLDELCAAKQIEAKTNEHRPSSKRQEHGAHGFCREHAPCQSRPNSMPRREF